MVQNVVHDPKVGVAAPSRQGTPTSNSRPPTSIVRPMAAQPLIPRMAETVQQYQSSGGSRLPKATHHHVHHHLHQHHHQTPSKIPTPVTPAINATYPELILPRKRECDVSRPGTVFPPETAIMARMKSPVQLHQLHQRRCASPRPPGHCDGTSTLDKRGGNPRSVMSRQTKPSTTQATSPQSSSVPTPVAQQAQQYLEQNIQAWMQPKPNAEMLVSSLTSLVSSRGLQYNDDRSSANGLSPSSSTGSSGPGGGQTSHDTPSTAIRTPSLSTQLPPGLSGSGYPSTNPRFFSSNLSLVSPGHCGGSVVGSGASALVTSMASVPGLPTSTSFPHSLSFSGYSQASALQGTSFSSPCASTNYVVTQQPSAAASFFARAAQRLNLSSKKRRRHHSGSEPEHQLVFRTNFSEIVKTSPPPAPPALLRGSGRIKDATGLGKVKVMLRICHGRSESDDSPPEQSSSSASFLNVDQRKKQLSVFDPSACGLTSPADRRVGVSAPKMFAFDAIFSQDDTQTEVCSSSLTDVIQAVVNGNDGCLFVYGHSNLGKTYTMTGGWSSPQELGVIPCALCWLFRLINEQKQRTGARFSVRVSAVEITGKNENLRDLLSDIASGTEGSGPSPAIYLRDDPIFGTRLMNHSELRAPTAEKAAFLLDAALAARSVAETDEDSRNSHFLFTLHVYQYRVEKGGKGGVAGGRSRLHLFDLGSCEKQAKPREGGVGGQCLTLSALGNVILALFNGQKHVPCKDSKVTQIMREALGSLTCRAAMIAHVSSHPSHYAESLSTIQLASRVHRMRRKKLKYMGVGTSDTVDDKLCRPFVRSHAVSDDAIKSGSSDPDYTSSSEQSCDTVIYVGAAGLPLPERDLTDNEGPPPPLGTLSRSLAIQNSSNPLASVAANKGAKSISTPPSNTDQVPKSASGESRCNDETQNGNASNATGKSALSKHCGTTAAAKASANRAHLINAETSQNKSTGAGQTPSVAGTPRKTNAKRNPSAKTGTVPAGQPGTAAVAKAKEVSSSQKDLKVQSDEMWIDGPRFCKPRFDSRTLHQLQKEQWVDGPAVNYGYMDDHKQDMILKWVEEHSKHAQSKQERMKEIWIDFPRGPVAGPGSGGILVEGQTAAAEYHRRPSFASHGERSHRNSSSLRRAKEEAKRRASAGSHCIGAKDDVDHSLTTSNVEKGGEALTAGAGDSDDNADSASTSADIDDGDNELGNMVNDLEDEEDRELKDEMFQGTLEELEETLSKTRQVILEYANSDDDDDLSPETIEVMDPEEPVQMQDSCLQVNEEDIMAACWMLDDATSAASENPLPEVDQESLEGSDEHPLRILSREGLNLASSFTDSRSVSVDLDTMSVPDESTRSWRHYVRGPTTLGKLRDPSSFAAAIRLSDPEETSSLHSGLRSDIFSQKLERIARLREISLAAAEGTKFSDRASESDITMSKTNSASKLNSGLPSRTARLTMSDMLFGSRDSSLDEMVEDVTSIHSEPAELDFDRCDYKFNIKPMNGLKLEAFYNKLYNTTSFLEQALQAKSPSASLLNSGSRLPSAKRQVTASPACYAVPKVESAAYQRSSNFVVAAAAALPTEKLKTVGSCRNLSGNVSDTGGAVENDILASGKRNSLDDRKRRSYITSLRHPDGSSNPHLNKHPSMTQITTPPIVVSASSSNSRLVNSPSSKPLRSPGSGACAAEVDEKTSGASLPEQNINYQMEYGTPFQYEKQTVPILTPGQSPTAKMSRLSRLLGRSGSGATISSEKTNKSKESSSSKHHKSPKSSPKLSCRSTPNASPSRQPHAVVGTPYGACSPAWIPSRSSPTSSSTGAPTMCCNSMKAIGGGRSSKSKQSTIPANGSSKHSPKIDKQQRKAAAMNNGCQNGNCCPNGDAKEHKKAQKSKILARSSSSPVTSCDEKDTLTEEAEQAILGKTPLMVGDSSTRKRSGTAASSSSGLPSPYSLITKARLTHHSSSGHGSDSSVNSGELRDCKEPLMKGMKGQQCSGTSSGYESILRDSEGTPLSSSSQDSECDDLTAAEGRGRKGKRKKVQGGSTKRSRSAPARVPNGNGQQRSPGATANGAPSAFVDNQPRPTSIGRSGRHHHHIQQHWGNGRLRTSEDDVCCTGLLCCRLLDFY